MTPNIGTARPRYNYGDEKDVCLNCRLRHCVHDVPGEGNSTKCPLNMRKARRRAQAKKKHLKRNKHR